ncbi:MAG: hypothetical protein ACRCTY_07700, partial [Candidatus Adiutrix sp.]
CARLQMAGGEFCVNATMALGTLLALDHNLPKGQETTIYIEVSGATDLVAVAVEPHANRAQATVSLPKPKNIQTQLLKLDGKQYELTTVEMEGITHIIVPEELISAEKSIKPWAEKAAITWNKVLKAEALGILIYNSHQCRINPLILVDSTQSLVWERGCGSGTAAIGAHLAHRAQGSLEVKVNQPGGTIRAKANYQSQEAIEISITGQAVLVARGIAYLSSAEKINMAIENL